MPNQTLYTGALKVVDRPSTNTARIPTVPARNYFRVPANLQSAARTFIENGGSSACHLKQAASVIFVRDGADGLETLLTFRPADSPLGVVAFPGGLVDPSDADPIPWVGPSPTQWQEVMQDADSGLAHAAVVGAIREAFEETGLLLAGADEMSTVEQGESLEQMDSREAIAAGDKTLAEYLAKRGLRVRSDLLRPLSRWQSPDFRHRRYDIHYFACAVPVGQKFTLLSSKGVWGEWVNVRQLLGTRGTSWLGDHIGVPATRGVVLEELLIPGVLCILETMAKSSTSVAFLAQKRRVEVKKAEVVMVGGEAMLTYTSPTAPGAWEKCASQLFKGSQDLTNS